MAILQSALGSVAAGLQGLWQAGAREFLVVNLPNFALTPAVRAAGPQAQGAATLFSTAFNGGLAQIVGSLSALPGVRFRGVDTFALLSSIVDDPAAVGLSNAEAACLRFGVVQNPFCRRPNDYLFWDGIHPTKAGHTLVAAAAADVLTAQ
jgi:phospholipase/lecithinase/hemolysin